ncbi:MAG: RHS repeat-associated core domain-containing protein [Pseudomonadota bacterium]|nr:RHS repeat-associated core domain-containing protein [Pseudomonadota bacterium]
MLADERGSIVAVTDWSGAAIQINSYDEYGAPAPGNAGRFGYTGQVWLPETGLYHYKNRAYNPELGRFMQTDPIGVNGGMNLYAYVGGDPVNFGDPLGLARVCVTPTGTHIQKCVYVDGNGDGDSSDDDLGRRLTSLFERAFRGFIINNHGLDLSQYGADVRGGGSDWTTMVRVVSQFVGYAYGGNTWENTTIYAFYSAGKFKAAEMEPRRSGDDPWEYVVRIYEYFGEHSSNPSDVARSLFHERLHFYDAEGVMLTNTPEHLALDARARQMLMETGLGGMGCSPVGGSGWQYLWGLLPPSVPGCE